MCVHYSHHLHAERILKASKVTIGSANSKVISFSWYTVMHKMESLLLERTNGCKKQGVLVSYFIRKEKLVSLLIKRKQKALDDDDESVAKLEFKGSPVWFDWFLTWGHLHRLLERVLQLLISCQEVPRRTEENNYRRWLFV